MNAFFDTLRVIKQSVGKSSQVISFETIRRNWESLTREIGINPEKIPPEVRLVYRFDSFPKYSFLTKGLSIQHIKKGTITLDSWVSEI